jgi:NAD(P)-dependent dehydrogenase (short-subunit alcohol dehydrogenase family)
VLAAELEGISQVRVNVLNPGRTRTAMRRQAYPAEDLETLPLPESITGAYLALLGPASRGVTGRSFDAQAPGGAASVAAASAASSSGVSSRN